MNGMVSPAVQQRDLEAQGAHGKLAARLYTPAGARRDGLLVFFPPGAFLRADLDEVDSFLQLLAQRSGWRVLASSYTLPAEAPFPAAVEDAHAVLKWAARQRARLGWDGSRLVTAGIEAGGNLAAVSALLARDRGGPALAAQLLIMPMLDPGLTSCSMRQVSNADGTEREAEACAAGYRDYLPRAVDRTHPYACPLQSSRMKGLPPALVLSAHDDPLRDEAEQYGAKLAAAGIPVTAKRLGPLPLREPNARCNCVHKDEVLDTIAAFLAGQDTRNEHGA
ncbi:MAG TPA: alpha/beta hydrolase [Noviherbaspirillum sp.]|uniref:alpha/beta hydrolase n=1 Tax=Noviherbaspirillum sp. TaxID=1926288 RepID=UPI002D747E39|nr:alpha/beta hydrolase [Noviherbaspirillum sp.]HYD93974.1 alpha/beta hydrolase [Noviherbaspirillum sp.]